MSKNLYSSSLSYLVIIQSAGLPLYAQSFEFKTDYDCQHFNGRLLTQEGHNILFGAMFSAVKDLAYEVIADQLKVIDLQFETYQILALNKEGLLFVGIFESFSEKRQDVSKNNDTYFILDSIAQCFLSIYSRDDINQNPVIVNTFDNFTQEINNLDIPLSVSYYRNCLQKCKDGYKHCIPHMLYYDQENISSETLQS